MQPIAHFPDPIAAPEFVRQALDPIAWVVPDRVPEGLTLLLGPRRIGQSELCLALALGVVSGSGPLGPLADPDAAVHPEAARSRVEARDRDLRP